MNFSPLSSPLSSPQSSSPARAQPPELSCRHQANKPASLPLKFIPIKSPAAVEAPALLRKVSLTPPNSPDSLDLITAAAGGRLPDFPKILPNMQGLSLAPLKIANSETDDDTVENEIDLLTVENEIDSFPDHDLPWDHLLSKEVDAKPLPPVDPEDIYCSDLE